jgi:para-aminobenzoate synthetase/4-amino-4-deoxychorismate lyase
LAWAFEGYEALSKDDVDAFLKREVAKVAIVQGTFSDTSSDTSFGTSLSATELATQTSQATHQAVMAGVANIQSSTTAKQFAQDIETIQAYIRQGDTYQINHTFRVTGQAYGEPLALYGRLRARQPGRYGAFIQHGNDYILSQSPELFIERRGNTLKAMPMKGTASALHASASELASDPKNRAENVMIVDLLRNDLSRLAELGSVKVPQLFEVARHGDVLQMTSTVEATAKADLNLMEILTAVFPCGSVTGAPKKRSMEIIQALETHERGFYCGALGWLDPNGDFSLSVPIRTVGLQTNPASQTSTFTLGVGAGITHGSDIDLEWQECNLKAEFLTALPSATGLFETILVKNAVVQNLALHLNRLANSAQALGIALNLNDANNMIQQACADCDVATQFRLRLDLASDGTLSYKLANLDPLVGVSNSSLTKDVVGSISGATTQASNDGLTEINSIFKNQNQPIVKVFWASDLLANPEQGVMHSGNILLQHKITDRTVYDQAWQLAVERGGFDALFVNERGFVTEGGRSSVFVKPKGSEQWLTPPVSAGVLPGVMRSIVLNDPTWQAREVDLTVADVMGAEEIMLSNALRGLIPANF